MTVEELIEELRGIPQTAVVEVQIRKNESIDGTVQPLYDFRETPIESVIYDLGRVSIRLDE